MKAQRSPDDIDFCSCSEAAQSGYWPPATAWSLKVYCYHLMNKSLRAGDEEGEGDSYKNEQGKEAKSKGVAYMGSVPDVSHDDWQEDQSIGLHQDAQSEENSS